MVTGARITGQIAGDVLNDPHFTESAVLIRESAGMRDDDGEWIRGTLTSSAVSVVQAPITGQERRVLPEALRDEDIRTFWLNAPAYSLRYGRADGDLFILGSLGPTPNTFAGQDRASVEALRDAVVEAGWLARYQRAVGLLIRLEIGDSLIYQRWDSGLNEWADADAYRAYSPRAWGAFTEIMGIRQDPGNREGL